MATQPEPCNDGIPSGGDEHATDWWEHAPGTGWEDYLAARTAFAGTLERQSVLHHLAKAVDRIFCAGEASSVPARGSDDGRPGPRGR